MAEDGGTRRLVDLQAELAELCLSPASFVAWLSANGAVAAHDLAVSVSGSLASVLERLLDAYGTPRAPGQVLADLASGGRVVGPKAPDPARAERRFRQLPAGERALYEELTEQMRALRMVLVERFGVPEEPFEAFMRSVALLAEGDEAGTSAARRYRRAMLERRRLLAGTEAKDQALVRLAPEIRAATRTIVFTQSIAVAERAKGVLADRLTPCHR